MMIKFLINSLQRLVLGIINIISLSYIRLFNFVKLWQIGYFKNVKLWLNRYLKNVQRWLIRYLKNIPKTINFNIVRLKFIRILKKVKDSYFILKKTKNLIYGIIKDTPLFILRYNFTIKYVIYIKNELNIEYFKGILFIVLHLFRVVLMYPLKNCKLEKELNQLSLFIFMILTSLFFLFYPLYVKMI
jgi:hypothetical protein